MRIRLNEDVTLENIKLNKKYNPQMKKHLEYILKEHGHNWFDKAGYVKTLGYEGADVKIFGTETSGNLITNFNWYMTKFKEAGTFDIDQGSVAVSELKAAKMRIEELEDKLEEANKMIEELMQDAGTEDEVATE